VRMIVRETEGPLLRPIGLTAIRKKKLKNQKGAVSLFEGETKKIAGDSHEQVFNQGAHKKKERNEGGGVTKRWKNEVCGFQRTVGGSGGGGKCM